MVYIFSEQSSELETTREPALSILTQGSVTCVDIIVNILDVMTAKLQA